LVGGKDPRANVRRFNLLYADHVRLVRSNVLDTVFDTLESDLRLFVAEWARHRVFVHAGVVGWKGKAIVIPGRSYSGKSTLVAEFVRAGATYYSDEYAVFDSLGRVHPFSKPIELRGEGDYRQSKVTVSELGGSAGTKPLPVGLVLMTQFKKGARWRPRKLTAGKGVLELLFNTVCARRYPEKALATLKRVAHKADVLKGVRGDATEVVAAMLQKAEQNGRMRA
jgi:molybdopterin/thiamine biosynthesis adenylyltransferase